LNVTEDTPVPALNPLPVTVTSVPGGPLSGVNEVTAVAATAGNTETVNVIVIAASDTTAPRTRARTRIPIVTSLPGSTRNQPLIIEHVRPGTQ
jgi:hypothetical protein